MDACRVEDLYIEFQDVFDDVEISLDDLYDYIENERIEEGSV